MTNHIVEYQVMDYFDSGFFGRVVCKSDLTGMTEVQKVQEKMALQALFPGHGIVEVIEVPALKGLK